MKHQSIKMVDLQRQYIRLKSEIDVEMQKVLNSSVYLKGPVAKEFEQDLSNFLQVKEVIPCANGTDALTIALMALDLKPGDEVIVPDLTFIASAEAIAFLDLTPVFVPSNPTTFLMDVNAIEKAITSKTRVIIPVHLYGQCVDMEPLMEIALKNKLYVIEDNAQAIGATYTFADRRVAKAGTIGHMGTTSFFPSKNLGCFGDGGAIFTNDVKLGALMRSISNHGVNKPYHHKYIGMNSRLDEIQAAVLKVKLKYLSQFNASRNKAALFYDKELKGVAQVLVPTRLTNSSHVFHQYTIKVENRDKLKAFLLDNGIPSMIYYPIPLHKQEAFAHKKFNTVSSTQSICDNVLSLPMHPDLTEEEQLRITSTIKKFYNNEA